MSTRDSSNEMLSSLESTLRFSYSHFSHCQLVNVLRRIFHCWDRRRLAVGEVWWKLTAAQHGRELTQFHYIFFFVLSREFMQNGNSRVNFQELHATNVWNINEKLQILSQYSRLSMMSAKVFLFSSMKSVWGITNFFSISSHFLMLMIWQVDDVHQT